MADNFFGASSRRIRDTQGCMAQEEETIHEARQETEAPDTDATS